MLLVIEVQLQLEKRPVGAPEGIMLPIYTRFIIAIVGIPMNQPGFHGMYQGF